MNNSVKIANHTKHSCFNNCQKEVINYEILSFSQQCCWEFRSSGMWCCVVGWMAPLFHRNVMPHNKVSNPRKPEPKIINSLINCMQDPRYTIPVKSLHKICNHIIPAANESSQSNWGWDIICFSDWDTSYHLYTLFWKPLKLPTQPWASRWQLIQYIRHQNK